MNSNIVWWFEIYVNDMERAKAFYQNVFQKGDWIDLSNNDMEMFWFPRKDDAPGAAWALTKMNDYGPSPKGTIVYFASEDCAIEQARVEQFGWKVNQPKTSIGEHGFISIFTDTEGNTIWIHSNK